MYKLIATDLDETLLNSQHQVSEMDKQSIKEMKEMGIKIVLATGRGFNTVDNTLKDIGLYDLKDQYVISFNGGCLTENKDNKIIDFTGLDFDIANYLYSDGVSKGYCMHAYTLDTTYIYNYVQAERDYVGGRMNIVETQEKTLDFLNREPMTKVIYMSFDIPALNEIEKEMKEKFKDKIETSYSSNRYLEFNCKGVNKGNGLKRLANILNINIRDTIAVGDNVNDLSMIKEAGLGIGVNNANKVIINDCDVILQASNDDNPITEIYNKYIKGK